MSGPADLAHKGNQALSSSDYKSAIDLYTKAIAQAPQAVDYYIKRSTAYQRSSQYPLALADAETAVKLGYHRGRGDAIGAAQLRRGISLYLLERYGDAGLCFNAALKYLGSGAGAGGVSGALTGKVASPEARGLEMWRRRLDMVLGNKEKIPEGDERRAVKVTEMPEGGVPTSAPTVLKKEVKKEVGKTLEIGPAAKAEGNTAKMATPISTKTSASQPPATIPPHTPGVLTPANKIRHEWYQTAKEVVFTLYVKGVPKDDPSTVIDIQERGLSISFAMPGNSIYSYDVDPLFRPIVPDSSSFQVLGTKIEVKLRKSEQGRKWGALEGVAEPVSVPKSEKGKEKADDSVAPAAAVTASAATATTKNKPPSYPTSSRTGPKNWDTIAAEAGRTEGTEDDLDDDFDPVNGFFKKLYKDADPDTRRAMMKSYIESNGTALSTNWGEVAKGKVETSPPEGLVAKKWGE